MFYGVHYIITETLSPIVVSVPVFPSHECISFMFDALAEFRHSLWGKWKWSPAKLKLWLAEILHGWRRAAPQLVSSVSSNNNYWHQMCVVHYTSVKQSFFPGVIERERRQQSGFFADVLVWFSRLLSFWTESQSCIDNIVVYPVNFWSDHDVVPSLMASRKNLVNDMVSSGRLSMLSMASFHCYFKLHCGHENSVIVAFIVY